MAKIEILMVYTSPGGVAAMKPDHIDENTIFNLRTPRDWHGNYDVTELTGIQETGRDL